MPEDAVYNSLRIYDCILLKTLVPSYYQNPMTKPMTNDAKQMTPKVNDQ